MRSTVFRLSVAFVLLFSIAFISVGGLVFSLATSELQGRLNQRISLEHESLAAVFRAEGMDGLETELSRRAVITDNGDRVYLLLTPGSDRLAGNIRPIGCLTGWNIVQEASVRFLRPQSDDPDLFYLFGSMLGDHCLMTGRSNEDVEETQEIILEGLGWGLLVVVVIGLAAAAFVGVNAQRRISSIEDVLASVARGDLGRRIAIANGKDDIDRIAVSINQALTRLERAIDSLKQVSVDIAHDLKTPVSRLRHRLEATRLEATGVESYREAIDAAIAESTSIVATFEALLRIAAIEAGARKARFCDVDLRDCLATVVEIYAPVAEDAGHTLTSDLAGGNGAIISGDHELLVQMFVNIIENSIGHCPAGSAIEILLDTIDGELRVDISDNGPGIPDPEHEKVFDRMYRLDKSRSRGGNGLGLSLVSAIADLHGASVSLANLSPGLRVRVAFSNPKSPAGASNR